MADNMEKQCLTIGLIKGIGWEYEISKEIINHLGLIFEDVEEKGNNFNEYAVILTSSRASKSNFDLENIIFIDEIIPLQNVYNYLSGFSDEFYRNNALLNPLINEYEFKLLEKIKEIFSKNNMPFVRKWYWPDYKTICCIMTHDIDVLHKGNVIVGKYIFDTNIEEIINIELEKNICSCFYFFSEYPRFQKKFYEQLLKIKKHECIEIGLHGSQFSFQSPEKLIEEKNKLESIISSKISTIRQHILNFNVPTTWRYQEKAGFKCDLSFYYNDEFGFRSGICLPYHPYDILENKPRTILEMPTSFMDWTAMFKNLNFNLTINMVNSILEIIKKYNGIFVLNFHNNNIFNKKYPQIRKTFESVLDLINNENYWNTTPITCSNWWKKREKTQIKIWFEKNKIIGTSNNISIPLVIEKEKTIKFTIIDKNFEVLLND